MACRLILKELRPKKKNQIHYAQYSHLQLGVPGLRRIARWSRGDKPYLLLKLFEAYFDSILCAFTRHSWKRLLRERQITQISLRNNVQAKIINLYFKEKYDIVISIGPMIISSNVLRVCGKILNLHNAKLPEFGGLSNEVWVRYFDQDTICSTLHTMTVKLDCGVVLQSSSASIYTDWSILRTNMENCRLSGRLLQDFLANSKSIPELKSEADIESTCRSIPSRQIMYELKRRNIKLLRLSDLKPLYD